MSPSSVASATPPGLPLHPVAFDDLDGWRDDDLVAALAAFRRGADVLGDHPPKPRALGIDAVALAERLRRATAIADEPEAARRFFETQFGPREPATPGQGFFTGFYEPEVPGSRTQTARFAVPLHRQPDDLVEIEPGAAGLDPDARFARKTASGLAPYLDRAAISAGALAGRDLEIAWVEDPVDAFFIHIQGAARIRLTDGGVMRITYAAKSGHPYTPIGKVLIQMGALTKDNLSMASIRAWLAAHPDEAAPVMAHNRSYVFFREAPVDDPRLGQIAAAKVPLTAGRSLAVDRTLHSFHTPVWVETTLADGRPMRRLMIAQDTGSAIVGPARGDIFFGSGDEAGALAGAMRAAGRFVVLAPRGDGP